MKIRRLLLLTCASLLMPPSVETNAQTPSNLQTNHFQVHDLDTPRDFPSIASVKEWMERKRQIREGILVSCGLWPMTEKTPLNAHVFGKIERDGYSIEKVYLETSPGFFLGGNLYRPLGHSTAPFPGILNPHGHWANGRMADSRDGSIPARCINFARQGMIAFSYDMVGYNDTHFSDAPTNQSFSDVHHEFATNRTDLLWNISLMGLQTWNSIRALDFLESLPDVDRHRLACTGESGGGTQTFMLGAIEDRLAAQAPVVMVSHTMQGGCLCENAPGLRVKYSNMEIAAAAAPRPQILVAASGDWTKDTLTVEGPAVASIYQLLGAQNKFHYVRFDFGHNYNQTSREAVYQWFGRWLLHAPNPAALKEIPYEKEPDASLRVFPDGRLPEGALTQQQFIAAWRQRLQRQWQALVPSGKAGLKKYQEQITPLWQHTLQLDGARVKTSIQSSEPTLAGPVTTAALKITGTQNGPAVEATYWAPPGLLEQGHPRVAVICAGGEGNQANAPASSAPLRFSLLEKGVAVLEITQFSAGETPDQFTNFYSTYNRTKVQQRVRDLVTVCSAAKSVDPRKPVLFEVILVGEGAAGPWAMLAAPAADAVVADGGGLKDTDEAALLTPDLFAPGLLALGGVEGAAILAAPRPILLHNIGAGFQTSNLSSAYVSTSGEHRLRIAPETLTTNEIGNWIAKVNN